MEAWAWVGFGSAVVVVFVLLIWLVARVTTGLGNSVSGLCMMLAAMIYSSAVTWYVMSKIALGQ